MDYNKPGSLKNCWALLFLQEFKFKQSCFNGSVGTGMEFGKFCNLGALTAVDDLSYIYDGNRLNNLSDGATSSTLFGFKNLTGSAAAYEYDSGGNMVSDPKKGISLDYNILNRTAKVTINTTTGRYIDYTYEAGGTLIRKQAFDNNSLVKTTDYIGGFIYEDNVLAHFAMADGSVRNANGVLKLEVS